MLYNTYLAYFLADYFHDKKKLGFWKHLVAKYDVDDILFIFELTKKIVENSQKTKNPIKNPTGLFIKLFYQYIKNTKEPLDKDKK